MTEAGGPAAAGCEEKAERLVAGLVQRDPAAYAEFCAHFGRRLHRYLAGSLQGDRELAEDLMVQTLAEAVRCIGRFDARKAAFAAWVFGVARRLVQVERRRQHRRKSVPASAQVSLDQLPETLSPTDLETSLTESLEAQRHVARLRACLSEREMEVLVLHYVHQLSVQEIGAIIGRSGRAVESLLHRAKAKARERLSEDA
jgi:RNA polymerase sigma factor (sigma-70 family)